VEPLAGGWLSGRRRKGAEHPTSTRAKMIPQRYDLSIPANQAKLEAADALGVLATRPASRSSRWRSPSSSATPP